jgi:hypothetical protein
LKLSAILWREGVAEGARRRINHIRWNKDAEPLIFAVAPLDSVIGVNQ